MATNSPIPRTLEPPPRTTGNPQQDLPLLVDWFYRAYQVITQSVDYINADSLSAGDNVSLLENDAGYIGTDYYELDGDTINFSNTVGGQEPSVSTDFTTKNYVDTLFSGSAHSPVTVTDSSEIDFTLAGQDITASIKAGSIAIGRLDTAVTTSLGLADTSVQPGDSISDLAQIYNVTEIDSGASPYTVLSTDEVINVTSGNVTINLPAIASSLGRMIRFSNRGTGIVTIDGNSSETINGAATLVFSSQYDSADLVGNSTEWGIY